MDEVVVRTKLHARCPHCEWRSFFASDSTDELRGALYEHLHVVHGWPNSGVDPGWALYEPAS